MADRPQRRPTPGTTTPLPATSVDGTQVGARRRPRGYLGSGHETIGSDILAVPAALEHLGREGRLGPRNLLEQILGAERRAALERIRADGWYPIEELLTMTDVLDARIGAFGLRRVGRTLFQLSHAERTAAALGCGRDVVFGIDGMYHHANRGRDIGGWTLLDVDDARAILEKTTPHHCAVEEGILAEALATVGCRAVVSQRQCFREGHDLCVFEVQCVGGRWAPDDDD